jgi:uncharacterized protein
MKRLFFVFLFILPVNVWALTFPSAQGFVNDFAGVLKPGVSQNLAAIITDFENKTQAELAIVTIASLEDETIEGATVQLFTQWGLGKKGKDNGLLILLALKERQARIEVGYGLEGMVPDAFAGRVLREGMIPFFKQGDMSQGLLMGAQLLMARVSQQTGVSLSGQVDPRQLGQLKPPPKKRSLLSTILRVLFFIAMGILFIKNPFLFFILLSSMGGGGRGGGFGGGGFGGFGGGLSGGGGASGRW